VPRGHWFCSEKCRAWVPDQHVADQSPVLRRRHPATARAEDRLVAPSLGGPLPARVTERQSGPYEIRRVGEAFWRRFATQAEAARSYGVSQRTINEIINGGYSPRFESRRVVKAAVNDGGAPQTDAVTTTDALAGRLFLCLSCNARTRS